GLLADLRDAAAHDLVDRGRVELRALERGALHDAEQVRGVHRREPAAALAERRPHGLHEKHVAHVDPPSWTRPGRIAVGADARALATAGRSAGGARSRRTLSPSAAVTAAPSVQADPFAILRHHRAPAEPPGEAGAQGAGRL